MDNSLISSWTPTPDPLTMTDALERQRRRREWNDRFIHWERPASVTEQGTIERALAKTRVALSGNRWLSDQGVVILPQGSYHNNTNVRTEADIDLRALHPAIKIEYDSNVHQKAARTILAYSDHALTCEEIFRAMRAELTEDLHRQFGKNSVVSGNKAIRIKGITGSRAEVDVVPAMRFNWVTWVHDQRRYNTIEGVCILSAAGRWTRNFPEQHAANGIAKRHRTAHRFKKVVRVFKRLRADMEEHGDHNVKVPSFLVECLVYTVEDAYFLVEADDHYDRVRRVALRMQELLRFPHIAASLTEINTIKKLFHPEQAWTYDQARAFVNAAVSYLGYA